jgi:hypothetical protein
MKNGKSLVSDGLPCEFYNAMWDSIGDDLYCLAIEAISSGVLTESLNQGLIKIIPKNVARDTSGG